MLRLGFKGSALGHYLGVLWFRIRASWASDLELWMLAWRGMCCHEYVVKFRACGTGRPGPPSSCYLECFFWF